MAVSPSPNARVPYVQQVQLGLITPRWTMRTQGPEVATELIPAEHLSRETLRR